MKGAFHTHTSTHITMDALVAKLEGTLSSDQATRQAAETYLEHALVPNASGEDVFGVHLAQILAAPAVGTPVRQAAAVALKKYVRRRWSPLFDTFLQEAAVDGKVQRLDATSVEHKEHIRTLLLTCIGDSETKVRRQASDIISLICTSDFPDHFPELLPTLQSSVRAYKSADPVAAAKVHGAMKCLVDLVHVELDEHQLLLVAQEFVPLLQDVLSSTDATVTPHTKARCINVFNECLVSLYMAKDTYADTVHMVTEHYLPLWLNGVQALMDPAGLRTVSWAGDARAWEELGLRNEVVQFLSTASRFSKIFATYAPHLLPTIVANLHALVPLFVETELTQSLSMPASVESESDVACEPSSLVAQCFTFLLRMGRSSAMRNMCVEGGVGGNGPATPVLREILLLMRTYAQATATDIETWDDDVDAYVEQNDACSVKGDLRADIADVLESFLDAFPLPVLRELRKCVAADVPAYAPEAWWVPMEAELWLIGAQHESIDEILDGREESDLLSIRHVLETLVLPHLTPDAPMYLCGRCFVFASQFVQAMPHDMAQRIFLAALEIVHASDVAVQLKMAAVRAVCNIRQRLPSVTEAEAAAVLAHFCALLPSVRGETLVLILDTLELFVPDKDGTQINLVALKHMVIAVLQTWRQHTNDHVVELSVSNVLESLMRCPVPGCAEQTLAVGVPALASCVVPDADAGVLGVAPSAAAMMRHMLRVAHADTLGKAGVIPSILPSVTAYLLAGSDTVAIQNLLQCTATACEKRPQDVLAWHDREGTPAIHVLVRVMERILGLDEDECGQAFGHFLVVLFEKAGSLLAPVMPPLLQALVTKLAHAVNPSCTQTLLYALVYLVAHHVDAVMAQLISTEVDGVLAIVVFVRRWLADVAYVTAHDVLAVHMQALMQLYMHWVPALDGVECDGDVLPAPPGQIMTRARAKAHKQYAQVPASTKVLKILLHEYSDGQRRLDEAHARAVRANAPLEERADEEWSDEDVDLCAELGLSPEDLAALEESSDESDGSMDTTGLEAALRAAGLPPDAAARIPPSLRTPRQVDSVILTWRLRQFFQALPDQPYVRQGVAHLNASEHACLRSLA